MPRGPQHAQSNQQSSRPHASHGILGSPSTKARDSFNSVPSSLLAYACDSSYLRFHAWATRHHNATVSRMGAPEQQDTLPLPLPITASEHTPYVPAMVPPFLRPLQGVPDPHVAAHASIERWWVPVNIHSKRCDRWFWTPLVRQALGVAVRGPDATPAWAPFLKPGDPAYYATLVAAYAEDFARRDISQDNPDAWYAVWEPARNTMDRHTRERVFKPKPFYGLRNDFRSLICPTALRVVESLGRCTVIQDTFDELSSLVARLLARIAASVPAAHPDPCATPNVLPLPRPTPDDGPLREGHGASVNLHAAVDYEQCSCDGGNDSCCSDDGLDNGAADAETWRPFGHGDDTEGDERWFSHADYEDAGCEPSIAVAAHVAERVFAQGTSPPSSVFSGDSDMDAVLRCAAIASPIAELMEDGTAGDRHVCQRSPALHSDSGSRTSFDTDMDALLGALQATPSPVFVRPPTPSGTPAQEGAAFDQWFRSLCRTRLPGEVPVPMTDVAMEHDLDAVQPSAVVPQPLSAPATHAVCSDDVDMGAGLATAGNNGAVPVEAAVPTPDVASATVPSSAVHTLRRQHTPSVVTTLTWRRVSRPPVTTAPCPPTAAVPTLDVASATVPFSSAVHGVHRRRRARLPWKTAPSTNGAAPSVLHPCLAKCGCPWPTSPRGLCSAPCNPPSLIHRACNLRWETAPSVAATWTWGWVLELPTTASCPCGPGLVGDVDKCFRRAAVSRR